MDFWCADCGSFFKRAGFAEIALGPQEAFFAFLIELGF